MSANLISERLSESITSGFLQYQYVRVYRTQNDSIYDALFDPDIPPIGQPLTISGVRTFCVSRVPRRLNDQTARSEVIIECTFVNDTQSYERTANGLPTSDPSQIVPLIQEDWEPVIEPAKYAYFLCCEDNNGTTVTASPQLVDRVGLPIAIMNSAGDPIRNEEQVQSHKLTITYWTWHRNWLTSWDAYFDTINDGTVTMTQYDEDGIRMQRTFAAHQLLVQGIRKEEHWRDAKLWFRRGVEMAVRYDGWDVRVIDQGLREILFDGQYKNFFWNADDQYDNTDYGASEVEYRSITEQDKDGNTVAIQEPEWMNGYGRDARYDRPGGGGLYPYFLIYQKYPETDFTALGIT